eukprot:s475_g2.t1
MMAIRLVCLLSLAPVGIGLAEPEECPLLQTAMRKDGTNHTAEFDWPHDKEDGLDLLTSEDWQIATVAGQLAWSTYMYPAMTKYYGDILKTVEAKEPWTGEDFMLARLVRSYDGKCWVAFRGTYNDAGWRMNYKIFKHQEKVKTVLGEEMWLASSWLNGYRLLEPGLKSAIQDAYKKEHCKPDNMYIVGHSMGGTMASYAALLDLVGEGGHHAKGVVTLGSPRPWLVTPEQCELLSEKLAPVHLRLVRYLALDGGKDELHDGVPSTPQPMFGMDSPRTSRFHHCANKDIALYAKDESTAPRVCSIKGISTYVCKALSIVHGLFKLSDDDPPFHEDKNDKSSWRLHDAMKYRDIVEANARLFAWAR